MRSRRVIDRRHASRRPKLTPVQAKVLAKMLYGGKDLRAFVAAGRSFPRTGRRRRGPAAVQGADVVPARQRGVGEREGDGRFVP